MAASGRSFRGAVVAVAGPGEHHQLAELIDSVRCYEGDDIKVVVADDATGEYPEDLVKRSFPSADFVRARVPGGHASCSFRTEQLAFLHLLEHYDAPVVLKLDPDALLIAPGAFSLARARFDEEPSLGVLGRTDTDYSFSRWVAHTEVRWSSRLRRLACSARQRRRHLVFAQGGAYFIARRALEAARSQRLIPFRQPGWSLLTEDVMMELIIQAAGFGVGQFGLPIGPIASEPGALPFEPADALALGAKVVHSVRSTPGGASEEEVRSFFRAARASPDDAGGLAGAAARDASGDAAPARSGDSSTRQLAR